MKALTNILTYMLLMLLLLIPASCTEEAAEVDNLTRQEEYVSVRINIPGMKSATTRADEEAEDNLTSVWALVFRDGKLVSKTEVTTTASTLNPTTSTTGTFNLTRPKSGDVIHFLGNLPSDVTLPEVGASESALCSLETSEREKLSYWGKATYTGSDIEVTLYRHLAKIEIAAGEYCTFPEDELFIAGFINANTVGKLVPYDEVNEAFNFDLGDNNYPTAVSSPLAATSELTNYGAGYSTSYYVFEHDNPETSDGLYVICKFGDIGKCYYKVALTSDGKTPYKIIRNHRYVIYVNDLDEGVGSYDDALIADPINLEVKEMKDVTLTITPSATSLQYGETSTEQVTVTVGGLQNVVKTLTFTAPGYTIISDYAESAGEGVFTITDTSLTEIDFTLTLTDPSQAGTISVTGSGEYVNSINTPTTTIALTQREEVNGETVMWQGAVKMHVPENGDAKHAGKIGVPYSFFFDESGNAKIPIGSIVRVESNGNGWMQAFNSAWESVWDFGQNGNDMTLTQEVLDKIKTSVDAWGVTSAFVLQGGDSRVLTKVTLIPAKESIIAKANKSQLYYNSNDTQVVTVTVTVPDGVQTLNIDGASNFKITKTAGDGTLNETLNETTYTMGSERTATFTFTLNQENVTNEQVITFSDPSESVNSEEVRISMVATPTVTFNYQDNQTINLNGGYLDVQMNGNNVSNDKVITLTITAPDFTVTAQNNVALSQNGNVWTYEGTLTTLRFTPTSSGTKNISINGEGVDVNVTSVNNITVNVTNETTSSVNLEILSPSPANVSIDLGSYNSWEEKSITMQLRIPVGVKQVSFGGESINNFTISPNSGGTFSNNVYTNSNSSSQQEVTFIVKINNDASLGEHIINITGEGDGITVNGTQLVVTITETTFGVTPTVANISNTNKSAEVTVVKPKSLSQFCFTISDNDMLEALGDSSHGFQCNNSIYYFYSSSTMEEIITIKLKDGKTITEENTCTITFYDSANTTQNENTKIVTITLQP